MIEGVKAALLDVRLHEVDIIEHPDAAVKYRVMATPAIVINGKVEFVGVPKEETLRARLLAAAKELSDDKGL